MDQQDVIILGAGAAGLMAALTAGQRGQRVTVIEHANKPGKKILMSGGGRCNFTNTGVTPECYLSHNRHFCRSALSRYTPKDFIQLVEKHGIEYHEKTLGQLFCNHKSKDIVNMLLQECREANVTLKLNTRIESVEAISDHQFQISTSQGRYSAPNVIVATGGLSIPTMGATALGYRIAKQFGLNVWPTRAGLVPFTLHEADKNQLAPLSGISLHCAAHCGQQQFEESMLITHRGLSGPAMLQISSYWTPGDALRIQLNPEQDFFQRLKESQAQHPKLSIQNCLGRWLPKRFIQQLIKSELLQKNLLQCKPADFKAISHQLEHWIIKPNNTEGYRTAEVTLGGVDCNDLSSKTMQANQVPGLFFIGEVVDVTGWLGGYNFQWAWASAVAAANAL